MPVDRSADVAGLGEALRLIEAHWDRSQQRGNVVRLIEAEIARLEGDKARTCVDCGAAFYIGPARERSFLDKGLALPRRCLRCRAERRQQHAERQPSPI